MVPSQVANSSPVQRVFAVGRHGSLYQIHGLKSRGFFSPGNKHPESLMAKKHMRYFFFGYFQDMEIFHVVGQKKTDDFPALLGKAWIF